MKCYPDIPYVENATDRQLLDIYLPEKQECDTLIWFHGGGLEAFDRKDADYPKAVTDAGYAFVSVEYRLYPDARYPEFIEDAANAVAYCLRRLPELGCTGRVFVFGESAGAYLTMMLCMNPQFLADAGVEQSRIAGFISDSAQQFCHFNVLREMGLDGRLERVNERAPIYYVREGLSLRPLLLMYYEDDMKCRPEETRLMYANLRVLVPDAHIEIEELPGGHCSRPRTPDGAFVMLERAFRFVEAVKAL